MLNCNNCKYFVVCGDRDRNIKCDGYEKKDNSIIYATKKDKSGNRYYLVVDLENKTVKFDYNLCWIDISKCVAITKKDRSKLYDHYINAGFIEL